MDIYCSVLSKKELLNKKYSSLIDKYRERQDLIVDYIIAATAWAKNLPLLTRNRKHFEHIEEIKLSPVYEA